MAPTAIADAKYISLTTFRRSGEAVSTPVWVVSLSDGRIGFWTADGTGKTKRLRHTARVVVQPSDARGRPTRGTDPVEGTAELVHDGERYDEVQRKVREKYGVMTTLTRMLATLGPQGRKGLTYADTAVLIRLA